MSTLVAVPSAQPGGLEATIDAHFGHCGLYTLVEIDNGEVKNVSTVPSCPHEQGGCMAPVQYLADNNVTALIPAAWACAAHGIQSGRHQGLPRQRSSFRRCRHRGFSPRQPARVQPGTHLRRRSITFLSRGSRRTVALSISQQIDGAASMVGNSLLYGSADVPV